MRPMAHTGSHDSTLSVISFPFSLTEAQSGFCAPPMGEVTSRLAKRKAKPRIASKYSTAMSGVMTAWKQPRSWFVGNLELVAFSLSG